MITVWANGRPIELPDRSTVSDLLAALELHPKSVAAVEHNGEPLARQAREAAVLDDGDRIELVRAVAGG